MTREDTHSPNEDTEETEPMRYGMLGEDESTPSEKLEKYTGEVDWRYLKAHFEAGVLLYVDPSVELTEVGEALAADDTGRVKAWRQAGNLLTPSRPHADYWSESGAVFRALVVSPFVLAQPIEPGS